MRVGRDSVNGVWGVGELSITKVSVFNIPNSRTDIPDPYVQFHVFDAIHQTSSVPAVTKCISNQNNPVWDLSKSPLKFDVNHSSVVTMKLWDSNTVAQDEELAAKILPPTDAHTRSFSGELVSRDVSRRITIAVEYTFHSTQQPASFDWNNLKKTVAAARQANTDIAVVLEGGGAKGLAYAGAFAVFDERGLTVSHVLGTSAGAITALALALGMGGTELTNVLNEEVNGKPVFACFLDSPINYNSYEAFDYIKLMFGSVVQKLAELKIKPDSQLMPIVIRGAACQGDAVLAWLCDKMDQNGRNASSFTFAQLFAKTGIHFSVTGTDITSKVLRILNHVTTPNCPVAWAVRISMSIPGVWVEVAWQKEWGLYLNDDITGNRFVDGGLLSNFPLRYLVDKDNKEVIRKMDHLPQNIKVIGVLLDEEKAVPGVVEAAPAETAPKVRAQEQAEEASSLPLVSVLSDTVNTVLSFGDLIYIEENQDKILRLGVKGFGTLEMDLPPIKKKALDDASRQSTRDFLSKFQNASKL